MAKKKVKVKIGDLRKYLEFCDMEVLYSRDVWKARCALMDAISDENETEEYRVAE